jgi:hypothetical protein
MKPSILVIYYSQSGQLRKIIDQILQPVQAQCTVDFAEIIPEKPFPFPWSAGVFFDCMPESVQLIPENILPLQLEQKNYDLIILGYQPWFLSPSIPFNSFLQSQQASFLKDKNVMTVIGSRNMWLNAQEKVKEKLIAMQANLVGNIVFFDRNPNLTSVLTIIRWTFKGQKEATKWMPEAGVQQQDITAASRFGPAILDALQNHSIGELHNKLLTLKAVELQPGLVILEKRGITNFRKFSKFILEKGGRGDAARKPRVQLFQRLLFVGVFILSPISNLTAGLITLLKKKSLMNEVEYFKNISYRKNAI